jgi:aminopeptidase-like protein
MSQATVAPAKLDIGRQMYGLLAELFPICRSLTGDGVRQTLEILGRRIPLTVHEVPSGTQAFDWTVPKEWNIRAAHITDEQGRVVIDFQRHNLYVVGYSLPVDQWMTLEELQPHLHSLPARPDAIPYVTSYYKERWGFCLSQHQRDALEPGRYRVYIDSDLKNGHLTYGECNLPGGPREVFLSTYICHPSMANNELSGPVVTAFLAKWLASQPHRHTYRIIFIPETIGSIVYLSRHLDELKSKVAVGFNISCVGDDRNYSYVASRYGNTYADRVAQNILTHKHPNFVRHSFLERGSDERQYCSPGVDLPVVSICRTKYGEYPEYHTSLDNLDLVTPSGLGGSLDLLQTCIELIERNRIYRVTCLGEPQLGKRNLYPTLSSGKGDKALRDMMNLIAYADGTNDLIDLSNITGLPVWDIYPIVDRLTEAGVLTATDLPVTDDRA